DVADALVLVRIRFSQRPDIRGDLSDLLPIHSADDQPGLLIDGYADARWNRILDRMRITQREDHRILFRFRTVANAHDFEFAAETFGHAFHRICNKSACKPVIRALRPAVVLADREDLLVFLFKLDSRRNWVRYRSLRSGHNNAVRLNI